jgi:amidophosphoribosyltransferase
MCGIIGIENNENACELAAAALLTLQHRGEESSGITVSGTVNMRTFKAMGLVSDTFNEETVARMKGTNAIGHVRYTTSSKSSLINAQPFQISCVHGDIALAHNGNITNFQGLKNTLTKRGAIFGHTSDTEIFLHLLAMSKGSLESIIKQTLSKLTGAFSIVMLKNSTLIGARDKWGYRPLFLGKLGSSYMFASETVAIEILGGTIVRSVKPGEVIIIENGKIKKSFFYGKSKKQSACIFEQVYFSRPDSVLFGKTVKLSRIEMGRLLARQMKHIKADFVSAVPESGVFAAQGFAKEAGIPLETAFIRSHYVGRSFIKPSQALRDLAVRMKLFPVRETVAGKEIVLIDDSLVRGTTARRIIAALRQAGAKKIHFALSCPQIIAPCRYGIDTPSKEQLMAAQNSIEQMKKSLNVDSLTFLSLENLVKAASSPETQKNCFCSACFGKGL